MLSLLAGDDLAQLGHNTPAYVHLLAEVMAVFDNSAANRRNPSSPPRDVRWGEGTADEMCIAFVGVTVDAEQLGYHPR